MELKTLTHQELHALWDALDQYVSNNSAEEVGVEALPDADQAKWEAASGLLAEVEAYVASVTDRGT